MRGLFGVLLLLVVNVAHAYTCVYPASSGQTLKVATLNVTDCGTTNWTVFTPSDMATYNATAAQVSAVSAVIAASDALQPFDPATAAEFWSFSLLFSLGLWLVAKNVGTLLSMFKPRSR